MFIVRKKAKFESAHRIPNHVDPIKGGPGKCSRLHGHSYTIAICVKSMYLDRNGFVIDFSYLGMILKELTEKWDHNYLNDLDDFKHGSPTAEYIAWLVHEHFKIRLNELGTIGRGVVIEYAECCETDGTEARFRDSIV